MKDNFDFGSQISLLYCAKTDSSYIEVVGLFIIVILIAGLSIFLHLRKANASLL